MAVTSYAGKVLYMDSESITTDGNGEAVMTLTATPYSDNCISLFCKSACRIAEFVSRTGAALTIRIRKVGTETNATLGDLPDGVSSQSGAFHTDRVDYTNTGGSGEHGGTDSHSHSVAGIIVHSHGLNDDTALMKATTETVVVVVTYAV